MGANKSKVTQISTPTNFDQRVIRLMSDNDYGDLKTSNTAKLNEEWGSLLDPELNSIFTNFVQWCQTVFTPTKYPTESKAICALYYGLTGDNYSLQARVLTDLLHPEGRSKDSGKSLSLDKLMEFTCLLIDSFMNIIDTERNDAFIGWAKFGATYKESSRQDLASYIMKRVVHSNGVVDAGHLESWLEKCPLFVKLQRHVVNKALKVDYMVRKHDILPINEIKVSACNTILDLCHIVALNAWVLPDYRKKWRLLYSTKSFGLSWIIMLNSIVNQGPTIIVIEDSDGNKFGGFTSTEWSISPHFQGDDCSFLFTLVPELHQMDPSGFNNHYQYLNNGAATFPNGLGMGGQLDYWGFFIDPSMSEGHVSPSCSTFTAYNMPCKGTFKIENIEVWSVGEPHKPTEEELESRSALDTQLEAKAMLEMIGRSQVSEGLRDPENIAETLTEPVE